MDRELGVLLDNGVGVGIEELVVMELVGTGWELGRLSAAARPTPLATTTAAAATAMTGARFMNSWA